uniref:Prolyl 4-hydroxylase alpha-subunit N-terminal domain-containing protein n=2 Tax=Ciona intestinalis TaxID=7719 RepID=F6RYN7_CIOIN
MLLMVGLFLLVIAILYAFCAQSGAGTSPEVIIDVDGDLDDLMNRLIKEATCKSNLIDNEEMQKDLLKMLSLIKVKIESERQEDLVALRSKFLEASLLLRSPKVGMTVPRIRKVASLQTFKGHESVVAVMRSSHRVIENYLNNGDKENALLEIDHIISA